MSTQHRYCPGCGQPAEGGAGFCGSCGRSLAKDAPASASPPNDPQASKTIFGIPPATIPEDPHEAPAAPSAEPRAGGTTPYFPAAPDSASAGASSPARIPGPLGAILPTEDRALRVLGIAAIVLFASRFIPTHVIRGYTAWSWSGDGETIFKMMVFPILAALAYAFFAFGPAHLRKSLPAGATRSVAFVFGYLGSALLYAVTPIAGLVGGGGLVAWAYPLLALGLLGLSQRSDCGVSRVFVGVGGLLTFIGAMIGVKFIFAFAGQGALIILHNVLYFIVVLLGLASTALAIPKSVWPQVDAFARFAPVFAAVTLAWPVVAWFLFSMSAAGVSKLTVLLHSAAALFGFFFVLWMYAPGTLDAVRRLVARVNTPPQNTAGG